MGKVVAVTGANRGIGRAIAVELHRRGHVVGCLSRGGEDLGLKGAIPLACDVTDETQARAALAALVERTGRLDALVNNAGLYLERASHECSTEDFDLVLRTNVTGAFVMAREAYPHFIAGGGGLIVNLGSFFDRLGVRYAAAYSASKAAIASLTRSLAVEWAKRNIRLLNVAPGYVRTDLNAPHMAKEAFRDFLKQRIPVGSPAEADEIARFIALLLEGDFPHWTGDTVTIDGAQAISQ
jgi:NAD(P)-dependent dehydrogenase (short-subunit alcohol dehydrogenase family)